MIDKNQKALLELIKASLFNAEPVFSDDVDWDAVLEEAKAQTVVALAAKAVPREYAQDWESSALQSRAAFMRILHGQTQLIKLFEQAEIPLVILKGTAAAMYYPEPSLRAMGDVDFLVPQDRYEEARCLMRENGYFQCQDNKGSRHVAFMKGGIEYELHHHFGTDSLAYGTILMEGLLHTERNNIYSACFPTFPNYENGLVLIDHVCKHLMQGRLGLRQIIDWMMYVHNKLDDVTWKNGFQQLVQTYRLETLAVTLTLLCHDWLGLPEHLDFIQNGDKELASELLEVILSHGNFGRKKGEEQAVERVRANVRRKGLFNYLQTAGLNRWSAAKKYPVLRPFAWIYYLGCWAHKGFRLILKPTKIRREFSSGKELYQLNRRLGIYDQKL